MHINATDEARHGVCFEGERMMDPTIVTTREFNEVNMPNTYKPNGEYKDLSLHPECRPTYTPPKVTEVSINMNNYGSIDNEDRHPRCLKQTMHTEYAKCGETVNRGYDPSSFNKTSTMGQSTVKDPRDAVDGYLNGVYLDKGYSIKRIEIPEEKIERNLNHYYSRATTMNKAQMPAAGVKTAGGEGISGTLARNYGAANSNYDELRKVETNTKNDTSTVHGFKPRINDVKPGYLGGPRSGGDLQYYVRQVE